MVIKHIVLSGGAYLGFYQLGALHQLSKRGFYQSKNIISIYGTSVGAILGTILCLNDDWDTTIDYFEQRPWYKMVKLTPRMLIELIPQKGLVSKDFIDDILLPIIKCRDYDETITLNDLFLLSNKVLYMYTIDLNKFELIELSYKTHPELPLLTALYMSCALPFIFQPIWKDNTYYIDGGLLNSYPILNCLKENSNVDEILSFKFNSTPCIEKITNESNIFEYSYFLYRKLINKAREKEVIELKNEVIIPCTEINIVDGAKIINSLEIRKQYINVGQQYADKLIERTK